MNSLGSGRASPWQGLFMAKTPQACLPIAQAGKEPTPSVAFLDLFIHILPLRHGILHSPHRRTVITAYLLSRSFFVLSQCKSQHVGPFELHSRGWIQTLRFPPTITNLRTARQMLTSFPRLCGKEPLLCHQAISPLLEFRLPNSRTGKGFLRPLRSSLTLG